MSTVPEVRVRRGNDEEPNPQGAFVLYWMTAFRRLGWNFALQHATDVARERSKPLVILEALRLDYPYASHRLHRFLLQGMEERHQELAAGPVLHVPFVEREPGSGKGLLSALGREAVLVVADDFPSFFLPEMVAAGGRALDVRLDLVDSNGLLPLRLPDQVYKTAYSFRRFLQGTLPDHLPEQPAPDPLRGGDLPEAGEGLLADVRKRWTPASGALLAGSGEALAELPLDSSVPPVPYPGTTASARERLTAFLEDGLSRYAEGSRHPDEEATSGLSPYLHFGTLSSHQIFQEVADREGWTPNRVSGNVDGARKGWWGMGEGAEAFLDQLVTWRELGFNMSSRRDDYTDYESLPEWARETLEKHEADQRPYLYSLEDFRDAETHDPLWNAAQRQLLEEGVIHNYLRMLWGKKILEWSVSPRDALDVMVELNDRYAVDGRDPNSYSGIFWCLGRYDRGWPERPVFGKIRSMTSASTRRKIHLNNYMDRFG